MINEQKAETGLDKSLPYIPVLMVKADGSVYPKCALPPGYRFSYYKPGMEEDFARLQYAVGGVDSIAAVGAIFQREFGDKLRLVEERMLFALNEKGEAVGTACLWQGDHFGPEMPMLHWVAVHPEYQNKGVAKALLTALLDRCSALGLGEKLYLISQTWSWKAIRIYIEFGFSPYAGPQPVGLSAVDFENNNSLAWNLIYDKLEAFEAERKRGLRMDEKLGAQVWYLFNSGFALQRGERMLIFDCYNSSSLKKRKGLEGGVIDTQELRDLDVTVFSSHAHMDHFVPGILKWGRDIPRLRYVLSYDIDAGRTANVTTAYPNASYMVGDTRVRTLKSNDEGVAFLVEVDGLRIFHAGDLNWWHWEGEPEDENREMGNAYKAEIDKLRGETIDIAFIPVDPRLEKEYLWGLDYFMRTVDAKVVFPMHFRNSYSVVSRLIEDPVTKDYRDRIMTITRRGERFEV